MEAPLDAAEPVVDGLPAGADEVDQKREVVDACVPLGEQIAFDPLEPPDHLVREAADLGEVAPDGLDLLAEPVLQRAFDPDREGRLDLRGGLRELLDLGPGALESRIDRGGIGAAFGGVPEAFSGSLDCVFGHRAQR